MNLIYPMFVLVVYIVALGIYTFIVRRNSVLSRQTHFKYFKTYDLSFGAPPEYVTRVGRHFDNQFQVPMLFLITIAMHLVVNETNFNSSLMSQAPSATYLNFYTAVLAWVFILTRLVHSYVHLGSNNVVYRFLSFATGLFIVLGLWILILLK